MTIPEQLKGMRFNRVRFKEKRAFEKGWQNNPYTYDQIQQYFPQENYGIICGPEIRVLDDDTPEKILINLYHKNFPETMEVRDHIYFKFDNEYADKIIFEHKTLQFPDSKGKMSHHMGELQGSGTYVVGPGSIHPSSEIYKLKKDLPIATISYKKFKEVFGEHFKEKKKQIVREHVSTNWEGDKITDIPISNIISFNGLIDVGNGCYQGPHPKHGSNGGMNFRVDTNINSYYCFRDQVGGGPSELIAVMEGIIECGEAGANCFTEDQAREVIKIAREKYGLTTPEPIEQDLGPVDGWALVSSITELAKKHNFTHCRICGHPFDFRESHGLYYCKYCGKGGGQKKFADLITQELNKKKDVSE